MMTSPLNLPFFTQTLTPAHGDIESLIDRVGDSDQEKIQGLGIGTIRPFVAIAALRHKLFLEIFLEWNVNVRKNAVDVKQSLLADRR